MPHSKPSKGIQQQAQLLSAFVKAFGKKLMAGKSHHAAVTAQLHDIPEGHSRMWARNAKLVMEEGITLLLDQLQAEIVSLDPLTPLIPEEREAYTFNIQHGRMAMDEASLSTLMNRYAFPAGQRSPLYNIRISLPDGLLVIDGTLRVNRWMTLALHMSNAVAVTAEGLIELQPLEIKSGAIPVGKIMETLGVELGRFMPATGQSAMRFEAGKILVDPTGLFPAPKASGKLVHAEVTGEHLVMSYDNGQPPTQPLLMEPDAPSYIAMLGHDLLVGKVMMKDINLQMIPLDPLAGWVEFSLPHYRWQLAQGESSLKFADELLYKLPPVSALKTPLPPQTPRLAPPSDPPAEGAS